MFTYAQARKQMVDTQLSPCGVSKQDLLKTYEFIPREIFAPEGKESISYLDKDVFFDDGRFLLAPMVHARMLDALEPQKEDVALDIGCASGYSSAILSFLVSTVIAVEEKQSYLDKAAQNWDELNLHNIAGIKSKLNKGNSKNAPFDIIVMNGAVPEIPRKIVAQLSEKGRMITTIKEPKATLGKVTLVKANAEQGYSTHVLFETACTYLPGFKSSSLFVF